jgi:CTP synthase (UTP-ammonia lyase)
VDDDDEVRVLELPQHAFYVATLYVPQARSTPAAPHPLITALPRAAVAREPRVAQAS